MNQPTEEVEFVREMRTRFHAEGGIFRADSGEFAIFDPGIAKEINAKNFSDFLLPDDLADVIRGKSSAPIQWKRVRSAWAEQLHRIANEGGPRQLAERMIGLVDRQLGVEQDLVWLMQDVVTRSLIPVVIDGLTPRAHQRVLDDQVFKLQRLLKPEPTAKTFRNELRSIRIQIQAGLAVRSELRGRAKDRRSRHLDLTDSVVNILHEIGMNRAVDAVTTVLTAIAGPPGAAANAILFELHRHPMWADRLREELTPLNFEAFCAAPMRQAPITHSFVKETLRMWSPPLFMTRPVRTDIGLSNGMEFKEGDRYFVSLFLMHRDPKNWDDPEAFNPDRWQGEQEHKGCPGSYVPFGWAPTSCVGAHLGTIQLMILCYLMTVRYRTLLKQPDDRRMSLNAVATPVEFVGKLVKR